MICSTPEPGAAERAPLPELDSLGDHSDVSAFLDPDVDELVRRAALRRVFLSPAFNVVDGLDDYDDDFTRFEPLGDIVTSDMRHQAEQHLDQRLHVRLSVPGIGRALHPRRLRSTIDQQVVIELLVPARPGQLRPLQRHLLSALPVRARRLRRRQRPRAPDGPLAQLPARRADDPDRRVPAPNHALLHAKPLRQRSGRRGAPGASICPILSDCEELPTLEGKGYEDLA